MCQKWREDMSSYAEGQTHQLLDKLEVVGFTADDITKLGQYPHLSRIRDVIRGKAEITYPQHLIDCDADPYIPSGWIVESHAKGGQLMFDRTKIKLYLSKAQEKGKAIEGNKLRKELVDQPVLNACVLDYLLAHLELIPDEWKDKAIFFWGTIYRSSVGNPSVRFLAWHGGRWLWGVRRLDLDWDANGPAALLASN